MKKNVLLDMIELAKNKILYVFRKLCLTINRIFCIIYPYILNIMKKIEFELIRNEGIYVKMTDEQKEIIKKLARCQKKSSSDFVKWVIFSKYINDFIK
ncbi:MAG TPA: hypothetical protein DG753_13505 [Clostridium sp.]|nr:hypothetical protein [Clostridium sp.]